MKTSISDKQLKKLLKYVPLEDLKLQEEHWGEVPDTYWIRVDEWYMFLIDYLKEYPVDHFSLSIILHEIQTHYHQYERKYFSYKESIPLAHSGAKGLLDALESFNDNFMNIESIQIQIKKHKPFTKDHITRDINEFRMKYAIPKTFKLTGKEVIIQLFKLVKENKHIFEPLSKSEEKLSGETYEFIIKNKPELFIRKLYSPVIYKYLNEHLPNYSYNKLITIGGFLFYRMDVLPKTHSDLTNNKKYIDHLRKNFVKYLPPAKDKN